MGLVRLGKRGGRFQPLGDTRSNLEHVCFSQNHLTLSEIMDFTALDDGQGLKF